MELVEVMSGEQIQSVAALAEEIWTECYGEILSGRQISYMLERYQSEEAMTRQLAEGYRYLMIREGESLCGYVGFCPLDRAGQTGRGLFLSKLYLKQEFRGRGLATETIAFLEGLVLSEGYDYLWLTVNRNNVRAAKRYEAVGFSCWACEDTPIGEGFFMEDFIMGKRADCMEKRPGCSTCGAEK